MQASVETDTPVERVMRTEFYAWQEQGQFLQSVDLGSGGSFPHPWDEGGIPDGWRAHVWHTDPRTTKSNATNTFVLVSTPAGGWGIMEHTARADADTGTTFIPHAEADLGDLYASMCGYADSYSLGNRLWGVQVEQMMREYIAPHYDLDDPTEAAEAVIVALGGRSYVMPAALR